MNGLEREKGENRNKNLRRSGTLIYIEIPKLIAQFLNVSADTALNVDTWRSRTTVARAKLNTAWKLNWGWSVGLFKAARRDILEIYIFVKIVAT